MPIANASSALQRFTVLDLTRVRAGPTAVRQPWIDCKALWAPMLPGMRKG